MTPSLGSSVVTVKPQHIKPGVAGGMLRHGISGASGLRLTTPIWAAHGTSNGHFDRRPSRAASSSSYLHGRPCGFFGDSTRECRCTPAIIQRYLSKISGPLLDRIDIHVEVPAVPYKELRGNATAEASAEIRARVERARGVQRARGHYNSRLPSREVRKLCMLDEAGERTLEMAVRKMGLSARAHDRILEVSRMELRVPETA